MHYTTFKASAQGVGSKQLNTRPIISKPFCSEPSGLVSEKFVHKLPNSEYGQYRFHWFGHFGDPGRRRGLLDPKGAPTLDLNTYQLNTIHRTGESKGPKTRPTGKP